MRHFIVKCRVCGAVQGQCRCPGPKSVDLVTCDECREKEENHEEDLEVVTCQLTD